jgi:ADP-heptose:LPS heptosyltransferase
MRPLMLVIRDSALGDLITSMPALRALRRAYPDHRIVATCPEGLRPLADWLGAADGYLSGKRAGSAADPSDHPDVDRRMIAGQWWRGMRPDVAVVLRVPNDPDLIRSLLATCPRLLVTYQTPAVAETRDCPNFTFDEHILRRWGRLLEAFCVQTDDQDFYLDGYLARHGDSLPALDRDSGATVIHVGAASPSRQWPADRWARIASSLEADGHHVLLTASRAEAEISARVRRNADLPPDRDLAGETDVLSLTGLIAHARLLLSTDTGPAHLAAAFRRPSVTLFGPVPPHWWGPPPGSAISACIWHGHFGDPYSSRPDPGLLHISVGEVIAMVRKVERLASPGPP